MSKIQAVIGAQYGDEGKGLMVDYLTSDEVRECSREGTIVVRFNGGAQAGHTVQAADGTRHVCSHFGAGLLNGIRTYFSADFILNPTMYFTEGREIERKGLEIPQILAHPMCRVSTPLDMLINQMTHHKLVDVTGGKPHGTTGMGIYETITRHEKDGNSNANRYGELLGMTPKQRGAWYDYLANVWAPLRYAELELTKVKNAMLLLKAFQTEASRLTWLNHFDKLAADTPDTHITLETIMCDHELIVFEGAQGLGLSPLHGVMPHCTPSHMGLMGIALTLAEDGYDPSVYDEHVEAYYVTRAYVTRHGAGPLPGETPGLRYADETNRAHAYQGDLRFAPLNRHNWSLMESRILADINNANKVSVELGTQYGLVITHLDQLPDEELDRIDEYAQPGNNSVPIAFGTSGPTAHDVNEFHVVEEQEEDL